MAVTNQGVAIPMPATAPGYAVGAPALTAAITNIDGRTLQVYTDIKALAGTSPTVTVSVYAVDPASGNNVLLLASAAYAATNDPTPALIEIGPGLAVTANVSANHLLPQKLAIIATIGGSAGPTAQFSVGYCFGP